MKRLLLGLCLALSISLTGQSPATAQPADVPAADARFGHYQPDAQFDGHVSESFYLPMRDGVRLAVRVDRPANGGVAADGQFPVIWHHTLSISQTTADGAGDEVSAYRRMQELTRHGYVVVQVARRGNGQSFGAMRGYHDRNEAQDSFEVTQWLGSQPWSTGKVGVYGCSNTGDAAMQVMTNRPPALAAVFAGCFSWHKYDAFRRGGIFAQWGTGPARSVEQDMAIDPVDGDEDKVLLAQAARQHQESTPLFDMWSGMPFRDSWSPIVSSRFWEEGSTARYAQQIRLSRVPVYIQGGWFDELRDQGIEAQLNIPGSRLIIGPWEHCDDGDFALFEEMHRFFDQHLKAIDTGLDDQAPIHYFTIDPAGEGRWNSAQTWPVAEAGRTAFSLGNGGLAQNIQPAWEKAFTADFSAECEGFGFGPMAQPCHNRGAGPSFTGQILDRPVEVTGEAMMDLWVSLDEGSDANVFAYLEDVAPDGTVTVVTEGRQKVSLRAAHDPQWQMPEGTVWHRSYEQDSQPVEEGEIVQLSFAMMPTSWVFNPGHRIQLTITGADYRERVRLPAQPPVIRLRGNRESASTLSLPIAN